MLSEVGLRYPTPNHGTQMGPSEGSAVSSSDTKEKLEFTAMMGMSHCEEWNNEATFFQAKNTTPRS